VANRVIKDSIWKSKKLAKCSVEAQLHYPRLYLIVDDWSCFEIDTEIIHGKVYPKLRKEVPHEFIGIYFNEYNVNGLLFIWTDEQGHDYGYFTGKEEGRLPPPTKRHKRSTPEPPQVDLLKYIKENNGIAPKTTTFLQDPSKRVQSACSNHNHNPNHNHKKKEDSNESSLEKQTASVKTYKDQIIELLVKMEEYWNKGLVWVKTKKKEGIKDTAIYYCLLTVEAKRPRGPWAFAEGILKDYNDSELYKKDNLFGDIVKDLKMVQKMKGVQK
jgi:hypothetical protein